ncbi:hypothetical protein C0Q70_16240 [Pomacea canaliculata]|uniref:Uncharacterized protein n=1 Tax=Pomacea canaliculata TaxID=400727 RepID=A0A2T7NP81_POMCA|nr:hypothetical protein C0Q70_16240 [Pomacea canaliculata]
MATIAGCMTNDNSTSSSISTTVRSKWFPTVLVPTLPRMSVPKLFHEPHVETGFRQTGAHCFSNKSEMVHYTCFMIDYAGIGLYGLGSGIIHYWHKIYLCIWFSFWEPSLTDHLEQMLWFVLGGFFFGSDIPQRFFPGLFDFIGHSHQIFHLCILMTSYKQLDAVYQDIITDEKELYAGEPPTFYNTYGAVLLGLIINFFIVLGFRQEARQKIDYEIHQITKEQ